MSGAYWTRHATVVVMVPPGDLGVVVDDKYCVSQVDISSALSGQVAIGDKICTANGRVLGRDEPFLSDTARTLHISTWVDADLDNLIAALLEKLRTCLIETLCQLIGLRSARVTVFCERPCARTVTQAPLTGLFYAAQVPFWC